ncbi:alpha-galactosidase [Hoeflea sp. YIM 152468]|uniref:alpha-galactosidase n=1 Tax=Hoeflea sp. YIM 152468 TaxID=3031759 RepID=UPI0023DC4880|nr:alpha-galactosidase [Hoeflea sp. YIM 152468]MDF1606754.1 alpha-galactosidase [Hoeflea sp. YIM 152468]
MLQPELPDFAVTDVHRLDGGDRTAVFASFNNGVPCLIHFGPTLPKPDDLAALAIATIANVGAGQIDPFQPLTLCPLAITGWQGHPGMILQDAQGRDYLANPQLAGIHADGANGVRFSLADRGNPDGISLVISVRLDPETGILRLSETLTLPDDWSCTWLAAAAVPAPTGMNRIIDHSGRWCGEFQRQETGWRTGAHSRESREGRTGHAHFPGVTLATAATGESTGDCLAATLAWSGGHRMLAEQLADGRRQVQFGVLDDGLARGEIVSPVLLLSWSDQGFNGIAQSFHRHTRSVQAPVSARRDREPHPVHYNCWEAVYFSHDLEELKTIASLAARLGAERFVLDDGWFRGRNDDTSSLGDWEIDRVKFPDGLTPLIEHVQAQGMRFGLWFEPEMVNRDSQLFRAHPGYMLGPVDQPSGRNQHVLDMASEEVRAHLFGQIDALLSAHRIDYVKWDHNRPLTGGRPDQARGFLTLLGDLVRAHPDVDFESCASGGGRIDFGVLELASRVWLSDSNDAIERLRMQHEASRWIAPEVQGSHVGPRHCHTSGRVLSMQFRAWVAAQRHMGFEMDPRDLTSDESATLRRVTAWWKHNRGFLFSGHLHRLDSDDGEVIAEMTVDTEANRFILFAGQAGASAQIAQRPLRAAGLDPDAIYQIALVNPEDVNERANRRIVNAFGNGGSERLSGAFLMNHGVRLPNAVPASMTVIEGRRIAPEQH